MVCSSSVPVFMASALNLIMKSVVFYFPCLKDSILYSASAIFVLSLNVILISLTKFSQFWVPSSLFSSLSFFCVYMPAISFLRQTKIAVILLLLRNNYIPLYQSLNFVQSPLNYSGSSTMLFGVTTYIFSLNAAGAGTTDISVSVCSYLFEAFSVICKDPSHSDNVLILSILLELILVPLCSLHYTCFIPTGNSV